MTSAQALTLPSWASGHTLFGVPLAPESIGPALRLLRERAGLNQQRLEQTAGLGASSLSRYERGSERPSIPTLTAILNGLGADLHDLADAIDELSGTRRSTRAGRSRATWVEGLRQRGVDRDVLFGFAYGAIEGDDPQAEADLVASAEEAARLLAAAVIEERRAFELERAREVAESSAPYGDPKPRRRG